MPFGLRLLVTALFISLAGVFALAADSADLFDALPDEVVVTKPPVKTLKSPWASTPIDQLPVGQLLIVGFKGTRIEEGLGEVLRDTKPGAILLFSRNIKTAQQVATLNQAAQRLSIKLSKSPLLIAVDQEGGNVIRIKHTPNLPSALAIAKTDDLALAKRAGHATGKLLRVLGFNTNLAPVVDVSDPETDAFLGSRSFGDDPKQVAGLGTATAQGLQSAMIMPVAKHFPGHGDTTDSHFGAASSPITRDEMMSRNMAPYFAFDKKLELPWGAMLAHVSYPKIDSSNAPATFSKPIVQGILRESIDNHILVMTDDIEMAGANAERDIGKRAVRALQAGADMVMIAWSKRIQILVLKAIKDSLKSGELKRERVEEALARIDAAKAVYTKNPTTLASNEALRESVRNPEFVAIGDAVLDSLLAKQAKHHPTAEGQPPLRIAKSADPVFVLSARRDFHTGFLKIAKDFKVRSLALREANRDLIIRTLRANPDSSIVSYASGRQTATFLAGLPDDLVKRMILINVETRAAIKNPDRFREIFDAYYRHPRLGEIIARNYLELPAARKMSGTEEDSQP